MALFWRSKLERIKSRKALRAIQQFETLFASFKDANAKDDRVRFALAGNVRPFWTVQEELGFTLLENGCTREAVNIFTSMELWEDVIECFQRMGQKVKAEHLILEELKKNPTPVMYCRLGDIREDTENYEKAWELSKQRSARSRKSLGKLYVKWQDYEKAAEALKQSDHLNPIDESVWVRSSKLFCYVSIILTIFVKQSSS